VKRHLTQGGPPPKAKEDAARKVVGDAVGYGEGNRDKEK
jgi:hypothetical protein